MQELYARTGEKNSQKIQRFMKMLEREGERMNKEKRREGNLPFEQRER